MKNVKQAPRGVVQAPLVGSTEPEALISFGPLWLLFFQTREETAFEQTKCATELLNSTNLIKAPA